MQESGGASHWVPSVNPSLDIRIPFLRNFEFQAYGSYHLSNSGAKSLLDAVVLRNYRSLTVQDNLKRTQYVRVNAGLRYSNNIDMIYAGVSGRFSYSTSNRMASSYYLQDYTITQWLDLDDDYRNYGASANISKYFGVKTLVISLQGNYDVMENNSGLQGDLISTKTRTANGMFGISSSALRWLTVSADVDYTFARNSRSNGYDTHSITLQGNLTVRPVKAVSIIGDVYYSWYKLTTTDMNNTPLCTVEVDWRLKKITLFAKCKNILNSKELLRATTTSFQTLTYYSKLRGCEGLIGVRMAF